MAIGDSRFARAGTDLATLLTNHGVSVTITRTDQSGVGTRDVFGTPILDNSATPQPYTPTTILTTILVTGQELNELEIIAGGKPKETLTFMTAPGVMLENDEVAYGGHLYKVVCAGETPLGGINALEMCRATMEVAV